MSSDTQHPRIEMGPPEDGDPNARLANPQQSIPDADTRQLPDADGLAVFPGDPNAPHSSVGDPAPGFSDRNFPYRRGASRVKDMDRPALEGKINPGYRPRQAGSLGATAVIESLPRPDKRVSRWRTAIAAGAAVLVAAGGGYYLHARSKDSFDDPAKDKGGSAAGLAPPEAAQQPTVEPSQNEDLGARYPHNPANDPTASRGNVDTSVKYSAEDTAYVYQFNNEMIPLPKLEAPSEGGLTVEDAFNRQATVLCAMLTAAANPDDISQAAFNSMLNIYADDPDAMRIYLTNPNPTPEHPNLGILQYFQSLFHMDGYTDVGIMLFARNLQVTVQNVQNPKTGEVYSEMAATGGDLYVRGLKQGPGGWQRKEGGIPAEAAVLKDYKASITGQGKFAGQFIDIWANKPGKPLTRINFGTPS